MGPWFTSSPRRRGRDRQSTRVSGQESGSLIAVPRRRISLYLFFRSPPPLTVFFLSRTAARASSARVWESLAHVSTSVCPNERSGGGGCHWFPPPHCNPLGPATIRSPTVHPFERRARTGNARRHPPSYHHQRHVPTRGRPTGTGAPTRPHQRGERRRGQPTANGGPRPCAVAGRRAVRVTPSERRQSSTRHPLRTVRGSVRASFVVDLDYDLFDPQWREWKPPVHNIIVLLLSYFLNAVASVVSPE